MISGMDTAQVQALAARLDAAAAQVRALETRLAAGLEQTTWVGADRDRFAEEWRSRHRVALRQAGDALEQGRELAAENLREQERASG